MSDKHIVCRLYFCDGALSWISRFRPTIVFGLLLLITTLIPFVYDAFSPWDWSKILKGLIHGLPFGVILCSWGVMGSIFFFPRIVVVIDLAEGEGDITLLCDGRQILIARKNRQSVPIRCQICFQVWRRALHQICLIVGNQSFLIEKANTYEHRVCQIKLPPKEKS